MRTIITTLLAVVSLVANAASYTNYFVPGTKWTTEIYGTQTSPATLSMQTIWLGEETTAYGAACMPMYEMTNYDESTKQFVKYIKVDGDKVYYHPDFDGEWELMYDFALQTGQVCYVGCPDWNLNQTQTSHYNYLINTSDTIIDGIPSMNMAVYSNGNISNHEKGVWLLGIGSTTGVANNCTYNMYGAWGVLVKVESNGSVVYEGTSAIKNISASDVTLKTFGQYVSISGLDRPTAVRIYTASGALVNETVTDGECYELKIKCPGLYLIKVGDRVYKTLVK